MFGLVRQLVLVLALVVSGGVYASTTTTPDSLVKNTADKIMVQLRSERKSIDENVNMTRVYSLVDEIVLPHFDFVRMSKWVLGKYWRKANAEQRAQFVEEFRTLLVRTYSKALIENLDSEIIYLPLRSGKKNDDVTVRTEIPQDGGFPIPIDYSMYLDDDAWKVYDVNIDGISLVANYRTTFSNEIRAKGIDSLIKTLVDRNEQAANE